MIIFFSFPKSQIQPLNYKGIFCFPLFRARILGSGRLNICIYIYIYRERERSDTATEALLTRYLVLRILESSSALTQKEKK